jgi:hypothetical protein
LGMRVGNGCIAHVASPWQHRANAHPPFVSE